MARRNNHNSRTSRSSSSHHATAGDGMALWLALAALVVVLDQLTKWSILARYQLGDSTTITHFFNIVRAHNTGAAFSFLASAGGWQRWFFTVLGLAASAFIVWLLHAHAGQKLFAFALSMILGGAIGNVIDRSVHGYVVDFLDFHWSFLSPLFYRGHFPAFNLADSAITLGAICLIVDELRRVRREG
ncbi:signal peptidase II [Ottowia sp.]|uniref:signal peptidase II n=1 Tax=Ottowia sp. TaxID=1898956 RepID=UPI003A851F51